MTVIPLKALFTMIAIWMAVDILDASVLHWIDMTANEILAKTLYETSLTLCCWFFDGRTIPA